MCRFFQEEPADGGVGLCCNWLFNIMLSGLIGGGVGVGLGIYGANNASKSIMNSMPNEPAYATHQAFAASVTIICISMIVGACIGAYVGYKVFECCHI